MCYTQVRQIGEQSLSAKYLEQWKLNAESIESLCKSLETFLFFGILFLSKQSLFFHFFFIALPFDKTLKHPFSSNTIFTDKQGDMNYISPLFFSDTNILHELVRYLKFRYHTCLRHAFTFLIDKIHLLCK